MAISDELLGFVRESLARGLSRADVEQVLVRAGWSSDQVSAALAAFADVEFPLPVPRPKPYLSARDAFMYLLLFSTLYVSAFNLGSLVFEFINHAFPDAAVETWRTQYARSSIRWSLSALIVAFPVFLYVSWLVGRSVRRDPGKRRSNVRRWLTYLTLFAAACVLIGDFTTLVYNLLGGELTTRFVLKVLTVAIIAGSIFTYYLVDLRVEDSKPAERTRWGGLLGILTVAVVAIVVVTGLFVLGSPGVERVRRLDVRRAADLQRLAASTDVFWTRHQRLPSSLDELADGDGLVVPRHDPSGEDYGYRVTGTRSYELCAKFQTDSAALPNTAGADFWSHPEGRQCFQLEAKGNR